MLAYITTHIKLTYYLLKDPREHWPVALDESYGVQKLYLQFLLPLIVLPAMLIAIDGVLHHEPLAGTRGAIIYLLLRLLFVFLSAKLLALLFRSMQKKQIHKIMVFAAVPLIISDFVYKVFEISAPVFLTILAVPLLLGGLISLLLLYASGVRNTSPENTPRDALRYAGAAEIIITYFVLDYLNSYVNSLFFHFVK